MGIPTKEEEENDAKYFGKKQKIKKIFLLTSFVICNNVQENSPKQSIIFEFFLTKKRGLFYYNLPQWKKCEKY